MIVQQLWIHGHSVAVEAPGNLAGEQRTGNTARFVGKAHSANWFHFAVPTPALMFNHRLNIRSVLVRFRTESTQTRVTAVDVFDGEQRIATQGGLNLAPSSWYQHRLDIAGTPELKLAIGISVRVEFQGTYDTQNTIQFSAAGVEFLP